MAFHIAHYTIFAAPCGAFLLAAQKYGGDESRLYALANQCWLANRRRWDKARLSTGQNKGYSSAKVLADAHKKSM